jgi:hypothetical protein
MDASLLPTLAAASSDTSFDRPPMRVYCAGALAVIAKQIAGRYSVSAHLRFLSERACPRSTELSQATPVTLTARTQQRPCFSASRVLLPSPDAAPLNPPQEIETPSTIPTLRPDSTSRYHHQMPPRPCSIACIVTDIYVRCRIRGSRWKPPDQP